MASKKRKLDEDSGLPCKRHAGPFQVLAKSHVFSSQSSQSSSRKLGFLLVVDIQSETQTLITARALSAFLKWDTLHVGLKYRCLGPVEQRDGYASFIQEESWSSIPPSSEPVPPEANPWPMYIGTVVETSSVPGFCKIKCEGSEEQAEFFDLIYASLLAVGVFLPTIQVGDAICVERCRLIEVKNGTDVLFADGGSLLRINGKTSDNARKNLSGKSPSKPTDSMASSDSQSQQRPRISPWFSAFHRLVAVLGYPVTPYYSWLEELAVLLEKKFASLVTDVDLSDRYNDMGFKCISNLCRSAGAPLPEIDFDFETVAERDFAGEVQVLSDDVISGLERITTRSPPSNVFPILAGFASEVETFGKETGVWAVGSREFLPSPQATLGFFSGCQVTGKALFKDDTASVTVVFEVPSGENGPDLTWMNRPCVIRKFVSYYENVHVTHFSYINVNVADVEFVAPAVIPPVETVSRDGNPRFNHRLWIVDRGRMLTWFHRPVYLLDVVLRLETPESSSTVVNRHTTRTLLVDGRNLAPLHQYMRPGMCTIWSFPKQNWRVFPTPSTIPPLTTAGVHVATKDFVKIYPTVDDTSPLQGRPEPEVVSEVVEKKKLMTYPLIQGTITDVYRHGYSGPKPQLRLTVSHQGLSLCLYCDEPNRRDLEPLGMLSFRELIISNVTLSQSAKGNTYLTATLKTEFQLGRVLCDEEFVHKEAPLSSLHRALVETNRWRLVKFIVRHVHRFGNFEFAAVCSACGAYVRNHSLDGPHCSRCTGSGWKLDAKALFMVNDGTCGAFVLDAKNMDVLTLMGFKESGKRLFMKILRQIRRFTLAPKNKPTIYMPDVKNNARYQSARNLLQQALKSTHPTQQLVVTAKVFMYSQLSNDPLPPGWVRFQGRLFCRKVDAVECIELPADWLKRADGAAASQWAKTRPR